MNGHQWVLPTAHAFKTICRRADHNCDTQPVEYRLGKIAELKGDCLLACLARLSLSKNFISRLARLSFE